MTAGNQARQVESERAYGGRGKGGDKDGTAKRAGKMVEWGVGEERKKRDRGRGRGREG